MSEFPAGTTSDSVREPSGLGSGGGAAPYAADAGSGSASGIAESWRNALIGLGVAIVGLFVAFWGTIAQMVITWYDSATFNHGFLILPICGWLVWERREALVKYAPRPTYIGLLPLLLCVVVWTVANAGAMNIGKEFALIAMIQCVIFTMLGWRLVRAMFFPLAFLYFAVPFGAFLIPTLQDVTAHMVVHGLRAINVPVFLDGVFITIPNGRFEVAEACSGVRFLIATLALGFLFANLSFRSPLRRGIIIVLSFVVPIIANGIRAFGIVYIAHITDNKVAVGVDHLIYGWIFFAIVTLLLIGIGMTFRETDGDNDIYMPTRRSDSQPGTHAGLRGMALAVAGSVAVAFAGPVYADAMLHRGVSTIAVPLSSPAQFGAWKSDAAQTPWRPVFLGADAELMKTYRQGDRNVHFYIAYYTHQRQGAELVNSGNTFEQKRVWGRASSGVVTAEIGGRKMEVNTVRLVNGERGRIVWEWYWIGDRYTSDPLVAKIYEAKAKLFGTNQASAAVVLAADYVDSPDDAVKTLKDFAAHLRGLPAILSRVARD